MVIEAFACKVPVVGSDSGEIPFAIGDAGVVVPESDVAAWTATLGALLSDRERRARLAVQGFEACRQRYDMGVVAREYVSFYRDVCGLKTERVAGD